MRSTEYDGMQKVAPAGTAEKAGVSDRISFKGVSSSPESTETADERVSRARDNNEYPASHVQPPPGPTAAEVFRHASVAGLQAGAVGGVVGAVVAGGFSKYNGDDNDQALCKAGRGALQGGTTAVATSFVHTAVAEGTGDALAGSAAGALVGATVGLAWQMERCSGTFKGSERSKCESTAVGGASGGLAGAVVGQALIPIPVVGGFVGGAVGRMIGGLAGAAAGEDWNDDPCIQLIVAGLIVRIVCFLYACVFLAAPLDHSGTAWHNCWLSKKWRKRACTCQWISFAIFLVVFEFPARFYYLAWTWWPQVAKGIGRNQFSTECHKWAKQLRSEFSVIFERSSKANSRVLLYKLLATGYNDTRHLGVLSKDIGGA